MQPLVRTLSRAPRASFFTRATYGPPQPRRAAHSSYGNEQSGHPQGQDQSNPKSHLEHPGPEAPASKASTNASSSQSKTRSNSNEKSKPAIHHPPSAAEDDNPEVRQHNEELRNRHDQSVNQLSEEDQKVDKGFWKGDVGDPKKNQS